MARITAHLNQLKKLTYGKHIVARVEKLLVAGNAAAVQQVCPDIHDHHLWSGMHAVLLTHVSPAPCPPAPCPVPPSTLVVACMQPWLHQHQHFLTGCCVQVQSGFIVELP